MAKEKKSDCKSGRKYNLELKEKLVAHLEEISKKQKIEHALGIEDVFSHLGLRKSSGYERVDCVPYKKEFVALLFLAYGINLRDFEWDQDDGTRESDRSKFFFKQEDLFTEFSPSFDRIDVKTLDVDGDGKLRHDRFARRYARIMKSEAHGARELYVAENLSKGSRLLPGKYIQGYQRAHKDIFGFIEEKLGLKTPSQPKKDEIPPAPLQEYERVLFLPFEDSNELLGNHPGKVTRALLLCSCNLFEHMTRCLHSKTTKAIFFVSRIVRNHHYAILVGEKENDRTIISEYYKYRIEDDKYLVAEPDIVIIEDITTERNKMYQLYDGYKADIESDRRIPITFEDIKSFIEDIAEGFDQYLEDKSKEIEKEFKKQLQTKTEIYNKIVAG